MKCTLKSKLNQTKYISRKSFKKHHTFHKRCHFSISFPNSVIRRCVCCWPFNINASVCFSFFSDSFDLSSFLSFSLFSLISVTFSYLSFINWIVSEPLLLTRFVCGSIASLFLVSDNLSLNLFQTTSEEFPSSSIFCFFLLSSLINLISYSASWTQNLF